MSSRVTLKDVANECGYTANTVSRAMRDDPRLPEVTRQTIREAASRLGYIPNKMASSLRSGKSHVIAVIVNDLHDQHFCQMLGKMDAELQSAGYSLLILCMQLNEELAQQLINTAISLSVDGILYFPHLRSQTPIQSMLDSHIPFVLLDRRVEDFTVDTVRCDDENGGYIAGNYLAGLGHRKFLYLSGLDISSSQIDRLSGFMKAIRENNIPEENVNVIPGVRVEDALLGNNLSDLIFPVDYTAIVCFRDEVAYPVINALHGNGVSIPRDVSVISFDNLYAENPSRPPVTSIYSADKNIAALGVGMLLERIGGSTVPPRNIVLPVSIFDHGTTGPCGLS